MEIEGICQPCAGFGGPMSAEAAAERLAKLGGEWRIEGDSLLRRFSFRNFARAMQMANLAGWLGEREGHHPDIAFGWGWCEIRFTSHEAGGLTANDFRCAAKLDALVA